MKIWKLITKKTKGPSQWRASHPLYPTWLITSMQHAKLYQIRRRAELAFQFGWT